MPRVKHFLIGSALLFGVIGGFSLVKNRKAPVATPQAPQVVEIALSPPKPVEMRLPAPKITPQPVVIAPPPPQPKVAEMEEIVEVDRISQLFSLDSSKLPIVETLSYTSRVPWLKGRPAWIADYATHYETSRHFIARSLNSKGKKPMTANGQVGPDYFSQKVSPGDRFNVLRKDLNVQFHLLIDLSRCRMWLYYLDLTSNERMLLKTYRVGLGRIDEMKASGYLTPAGKYQLGEKIAIYKPGTLGIFQDNKVEMIRVFGTRWIPFEKEVEGCTESAKGFGIHGAPWVADASGQLVEDLGKIGTYDSDGCIRLSSADMEEIFAIIITKPTTVELVKDFRQAKLPGVERK